MYQNFPVNQMTIAMFISALREGVVTQAALLETWTSYHSKELHNALMLLTAEEQQKYIDIIIAQDNLYFPPSNRAEVVTEDVGWNEYASIEEIEDEDERLSMARFVAIVSLLNNMARDYGLGHDRIVMVFNEDANNPESELYRLCVAAFGAEHPVNGEQIARTLLACAADPNEHIYNIFKDQFDALATIVYHSVETDDEKGDPVMVYSHNDQFYITLHGEYITTTHPSGDVYVAIQDAAGVSAEALDKDEE